MNENCCLYTENLDVGYKNKIIISDINFEMEKGSIYTLIGPNGAGKSTILKTIASQLKKINGCIYINGMETEKYKHSELAEIISAMFTAKRETELLTCFDVASVGRYPYTGKIGVLSDNDKNKIYEALEMTGMREMADTDFRFISDGQRQRVLLAGAICQEPEILILDEPVTFLDIKHKYGIMKIIKSLAQKNNTAVLMSLHELELAHKISDKVLCVKDGKIDRIGAAEEIFSGDYIKKLFELDDDDEIF